MNMKIIVGLLVGLIIIQIIGAIIFFNLPAKNTTVELPPPPELSQNTSETPAKLTLNADKQIVKRNEDVAVVVELDTSGRVVEGVDVTLKYDPSFLEPILVNRMPFVPGRLFPDIPLNSYDSRIGVATMSAITPLNQNYIGMGTVGVISFKAKKAGMTAISLQAEPGNTVDSNVVSDGQEILGETKNVSITIE